MVAKLIRASDDRVLWSGAFEQERQDLFGLQEQVAAAVARTLRPNLERAVLAATTVDPEAYHLYLRGLSAWRQSTGPSVQEAIGYFERAAEKDPRSARPWPAMAAAYLRLPFLSLKIPQREVADKARSAALRALEIDARSGEAHAVLGGLKWGDGDWKAAQAEFTRAVELNPNSSFVWDVYSVNLRDSNHLPDALNAALRAERLDPLSPEAGEHVAWVYYFQRKYDEALAQCRRLAERYPEYRRGAMLRVYVAKGMCAETMQLLDMPGESHEGFRPYALARCGQKEKAVAMLRRVEVGGHKRGAVLGVAKAYTALGDRELALDWLERSYRAGDALLGLSSPEWEPLREEPRFKALRKAIGLAE